MPKMMSPNTRIDWYPEGAFANPAEPTEAELNAGTNISCAIVTGHTLNFTDSDTDDSKTICDEGNVQNRGFANYEANISIFRDPLGADPTVFTTARDIFKDGRVAGWLVSRQGYKSSVAYAEDQDVSLYSVLSDYVRTTAADGGGPVQVEIPFMQQGEAYANVPVVADGSGEN